MPMRQVLILFLMKQHQTKQTLTLLCLAKWFQACKKNFFLVTWSHFARNLSQEAVWIRRLNDRERMCALLECAKGTLILFWIGTSGSKRRLRLYWTWRTCSESKKRHGSGPGCESLTGNWSLRSGCFVWAQLPILSSRIKCKGVNPCTPVQEEKKSIKEGWAHII